jgi:hypothetical protein
MKTRMKWRFVAMPIALAGIAVPAVACDQVGGGNPLDTLCCKEFTAGADLTAIDWGIQGTAGVSFSAFMQASADFTGAASAMVNDVTASCRQLAIDLNADNTTIQTTDRETDPAKRATAWCNLAVTQINAALKGATLAVNFQPPSCTVSVNAQASCEAKCTADVMCQGSLGEIAVRCDPAQLSGRCEADCTATCEGSANLAVTCDGVCSGTCEGQCDAKANTSGACAGQCKGTCRGSCKVASMAKVACEGDCTGGCSIAVKAPKCKGTLKPPDASCKADATCSGSCRASASAKAECKDPSLDITSNIDPKVLATLKVNLPRLVSIAQARGKLLVDNATAVATFGADIDASNLSVKGGACLLPAVSAIGAAVANVKAGLAGSLSVVSVVGVK